MGVVNLTPDSFSGDGLAGQHARALELAWRQIEAGAQILDLGAESSRPGAQPTPEALELERLIPVLEGLSACGVPLSVDTYKPAVMRAALAAGADMINDISGFRDPESIELVAESDCGVCVMHMQGEPLNMQQQPRYSDVLTEVRDFLAQRVAALTRAGVAKKRIVLDPGLGFGKALEHNIALFRAISALDCGQGLPVLIGASRKSMLGTITGRPVSERLAASLAAAVMAAEYGAAIVRVHDVAETRDALAVWKALSHQNNRPGRAGDE